MTHSRSKIKVITQSLGETECCLKTVKLLHYLLANSSHLRLRKLVTRKFTLTSLCPIAVISKSICKTISPQI